MSNRSCLAPWLAGDEALFKLYVLPVKFSDTDIHT